MDSLLSQTAEYALRAMAGLVLLSPEEPMRAGDLAKRCGIPSHYLAKILRRLVLAEILESSKGKGGGFALVLPADAISFKDVLTAVDAYPTEKRCAFGWGVCNAARPCPLHDKWTAMSEKFRDWAATTTFAELGELAHSSRRRRGALRRSKQ
jgi:Rrf2 family protein